MTKTVLLLFVSASIVFLSCKKSSDDNYSRLKQTSYQFLTTYKKAEGFQTLDYDANGRLITVNGQLTEFILSSNTKYERTMSITVAYNANGQLEKSTHATNNVPMYYYNYFYNGKGQVIKKIHTSLHPSDEAVDHAYTYDAQGRLIADSVYAIPGYLYKYSTYQYDAAGNVVVNGGAGRSTLGGDLTPYGEGYSKYDNKRNPYSLFESKYHALFEATDLFSPNNIVESGAMNGAFKETRQNVYLSNGLLEKRTRFVSTDVIITESFVYE